MNNRRRVLSNAPADRIVGAIQAQQHMRPHQSVAQAMEAAQRQVVFCPEASETAVSLLGLDPQGKIGRLRGTQITQLARTIARIWQRGQRAAAQQV